MTNEDAEFDVYVPTEDPSEPNTITPSAFRTVAYTTLSLALSLAAGYLIGWALGVVLDRIGNNSA